MADQRKRLRAIEPESAPALAVADSGRTTRMTARDELQQWVDGVDATHEDGLADLTHDVIPVDLARRVLDEMDEAKEVNRLVMSTLDRALTAVCEIAEVPDDIDDPDYPFEKLARIKAERDATLATLDAVRNLVTAEDGSWLTPMLTDFHGRTFPRIIGDHDVRSDDEVKLDILRIIREDHGYKVVEAIDDRPRVIRLWQSQGIPCEVVYRADWESVGEAYGDLLDGRTWDEFPGGEA